MNRNSYNTTQHSSGEQIEERYFYERDDLVRQLFQAALSDVHDQFTLHVMFKAFFWFVLEANTQHFFIFFSEFKIVSSFSIFGLETPNLVR